VALSEAHMLRRAIVGAGATPKGFGGVAALIPVIADARVCSGTAEKTPGRASKRATACSRSTGPSGSVRSRHASGRRSRDPKSMIYGGEGITFARLNCLQIGREFFQDGDDALNGSFFDVHTTRRQACREVEQMRREHSCQRREPWNRAAFGDGVSIDGSERKIACRAPVKRVRDIDRRDRQSIALADRHAAGP